MISPGEIYFAKFHGINPHPVIVVSREELNRGDYVVVVFCTSANFAKRRGLPNCVPFMVGEFGITADCVAQCEYVLTIETLDLDLNAGPIGVLDEVALRDVKKAIGYVIECDCEPI